MSDVIDCGRFAERSRQVMPRWEDRDRMSPKEFAAHLADTGPRWELLRAFQEEWGYEPPGGEPRWPRWSEDAHRAYVRRLKEEATGEEEDTFADVDLTLPIPAPLDEWVGPAVPLVHLPATALLDESGLAIEGSARYSKGS